MSNRPERYIQLANQYEPEGIHLTLPFEGTAPLLQGWGDNPGYHSQFTYNGVPLKGHPGLDFLLPAGSSILSVDAGRVVEISHEPGGFGRYVKLEHRWGESLYAHLGDLFVESGQRVERGRKLGGTELVARGSPPHLHFAIRLAPYNRLDGWGGFADPLPYLYMPEPFLPLPADAENGIAAEVTGLPAMLQERSGIRRP